MGNINSEACVGFRGNSESSDQKFPSPRSETDGAMSLRAKIHILEQMQHDQREVPHSETNPPARTSLGGLPGSGRQALLDLTSWLGSLDEGSQVELPEAVKVRKMRLKTMKRGRTTCADIAPTKLKKELPLRFDLSSDDEMVKGIVYDSEALEDCFFPETGGSFSSISTCPTASNTPRVYDLAAHDSDGDDVNDPIAHDTEGVESD